MKLTAQPSQPVTPTEHLVVVGPSAIAATIEAFAAGAALDWAEQVVVVASAPAARQLAAAGAAARLGLNVDPLVDALRAAGLPDRPTGAAYVRLVDRTGVPDHIRTPFGLLIYGRQGVRNQGGMFVESSLDLVVAVIEPGRDPILLGGDDRAAVMRGLQSASLRRDGIAEDLGPQGHVVVDHGPHRQSIRLYLAR